MVDELSVRRNAKAVADMRKALNISLAEMGRVLGYSAALLAEYEAGKTPIPHELLLLAKLMKVNHDAKTTLTSVLQTGGKVTC